MPPNLILKSAFNIYILRGKGSQKFTAVHGVTDVRSANRLLGPKTPELYVSIKIKTSECEHRRRTKNMRDLAARWEEGFTL